MARAQAEGVQFDQLSQKAERRTLPTAEWQALTQESRYDALAVDSRKDDAFGPIARWLLATGGAEFSGQRREPEEILRHNAGLLSGITRLRMATEAPDDEVPLSAVAHDGIVILGADPSWLPAAVALARAGGAVLDLDPFFQTREGKLPKMTFGQQNPQVAEALRAIAGHAVTFEVAFE